MCIENGFNDRFMLQAATLSIIVIGRESTAQKAFAGADICLHSIVDALDLLLQTERIVVTLHG